MENTVKLLRKWVIDKTITEDQRELLATVWSKLCDIEGFGGQMSDTIRELVSGNHVTGNYIRNQVIAISERTADIEKNITEIVVQLLASMCVPEDRIKEMKTEIRVDLVDILKANRVKV